MDDEHDAPESPPSLSRGNSVPHPDGDTGHVIDDTLSLLVSSVETEGEKELPPCTTFEELPSRRELPGRIFHDFATGQVHVYVAPHMYPEPKLDPAPGIPVNCPSVSRQRWRPNSQQLTLLERHFNAGARHLTGRFVAERICRFLQGVARVIHSCAECRRSDGDAGLCLAQKQTRTHKTLSVKWTSDVNDANADAAAVKRRNQYAVHGGHHVWIDRKLSSVHAEKSEAADGSSSPTGHPSI